jgi:hypothetical protein
MGLFDSIVSVLSGGTSDIIKGQMPGTDVAQIIGGDTAAKLYDELAQSVATGALSDAYHAVENGGSVFDVIDRGIDPGGTVDWSLRSVGEQLPQGVRDVAPTAGAVIGGVVGSYVPVIGTAAGAAIGRGVGGKFQGQSNQQNMIGAGTTYALAEGGSQIGNMMGGSNVGTGDFNAAGQEIMASPSVSYGAGYDPIPTASSQLAGTGDVDPTTGQEIMTTPDKAYGEGYRLAPDIPNKVGTGDFNPETGEEIMASPKEAYGPGYAGDVSKSLGWRDYLDYANRIAKLMGGSGGAFGPGMSAQMPGTSPDMGQVAEYLARGRGKDSNLTTEGVEAPTYGATFVNQNQIDKYNPQELYYS